MSPTASTATTTRSPYNVSSKAEDEGQGIWSSLLDSVSSGKKLALKRLLVLGGSPDNQQNFLEALAQDQSSKRRPVDRLTPKSPTNTHRFALSYTYQDVLDADQDDTLARLSLYLLGDPYPAFAPLLKPLFTAESVKDLLVVLLLDWADPWNWIRQLLDRIRLLLSVLENVDQTCKVAMEENMTAWQERRKGPTPENLTNETDVNHSVVSGPGSWDEPIGVPICIVCQNSEKMEILEREHRWSEDEFDFLQQFLRTILLKHGGSLIYTASANTGSLQTLLRSSLDVSSLLQKNPVRHNVIDREKVLIPPNWDSWGKIRTQAGEFDIEGVSQAWSNAMRQPRRNEESHRPSEQVHNGKFKEHSTPLDAGFEERPHVLNLFENVVTAPNTTVSNSNDDIEVHCQTNQTFLAEQLKELENLRTHDEETQKTKDARRTNTGQLSSREAHHSQEVNQIIDHIGPVQINRGGIQVDVDDSLQMIRNRETDRTSEEEPVSSSKDKLDSEGLRNFFENLKSGGSRSVANNSK